MPSNSPIITVSGHAEQEFPAERCSVALAVSAERASASQAHSSVVASLGSVIQIIEKLEAARPSPLERWSTNQFTQRKYRPHSLSDTKVPFRYQVAASVNVMFRDLDKIGDFIRHLAESDDVEVGHLQWELTKTSLDAYMGTVRGLAIHDAVGKATSYAMALGLSAVDALELADPGMLGDRTPSPESRSMIAFSAHSGGGDSIDLNPRPITLTARVDARFEAR